MREKYPSLFSKRKYREGTPCLICGFIIFDYLLYFRDFVTVPLQENSV